MKPTKKAKGLYPMPPPIVVAREVVRAALIANQTGKDLVRVAIPIVRLFSGRKRRR